ncbi:hypothetical protein X777_15944, partial [Ooceraea biroi]
KDWTVIRSTSTVARTSRVLLYDNNGDDPFSKPVISPDSVCEVLKCGAVFYRHDHGRERTVKVLSRGGCRWGHGYTSRSREKASRTRRCADCGKECRRGIVKRLRASQASSTRGSPRFRLKRDSLAAGVPYGRAVDKERQPRPLVYGDVCPYKADKPP